MNLFIYINKKKADGLCRNLPNKIRGLSNHYKGLVQISLQSSTDSPDSFVVPMLLSEKEKEPFHWNCSSLLGFPG
jgi:hypothetical protein